MHDTIKTLMDKAYDRFKVNAHWSKEDFWDQLSPAEEVAVFFGNMNYQVGNGGWTQWGPMGNGYGTPRTAVFLMKHLTKMQEKWPVAKTAIEILENAWEAMCDWDEDDNDESVWEDISNQLNDLDTKYYDIDEKLMDAVDEYILETFPQEDPQLGNSIKLVLELAEQNVIEDDLAGSMKETRSAQLAAIERVKAAFAHLI